MTKTDPSKDNSTDLLRLSLIKTPTNTTKKMPETTSRFNKKQNIEKTKWQDKRKSNCVDIRLKFIIYDIDSGLFFQNYRKRAKILNSNCENRLTSSFLLWNFFFTTCLVHNVIRRLALLYCI
jgi:hypothetical protein